MILAKRLYLSIMPTMVQTVKQFRGYRLWRHLTARCWIRAAGNERAGQQVDRTSAYASSRLGVRSSRALLTYPMLVSFALLGDLQPCVAQAQQTDAHNVLGSTRSIQSRVDELMARMTLEEKVSQLVNQSRAVPRLHIPAYDWWSEALHGIAGPGIATVFPEPIALAATFDAPLVYDVAAAIGTEGRAKHNIAVRAGRRDMLEGLDFWAPNVNIFRDPRWGRGQETYGEDPFLTARMAVAYVTGMQGNDPRYYRAIATPKHFAVHSGPEPVRHTIDVVVSKHDLQDTYLPAFRAAVVEGKAGSVMCSYNSVNGSPACANAYLLHDLLRTSWGFQGYVVSDCDAIDEILSQHHFTKTIAEAAALSLKAGAENECVDSYAPALDSSDYAKYMDALKAKLITTNDIDVAVARLLTARFRLGEFDAPEQVRYTQLAEEDVDSESHRKLALRSAEESMVLLKNDGILPLAKVSKQVLVVGSLANSVPVLKGNYNGTPSSVVTAIDGIRKEFGAANVAYETGVNFMGEETLVPASVFTTAAGDAGLDAEYFSNEEFQGKPVLARRDNRADLDSLPAGKDSLVQPAGLKEYSVRWSGFLTPESSGQYQLEATGYTNRLWLDGKVIIDNSKAHIDGDRIATVNLEQGHRYSFKLECAVQDDLGATLLWVRLLDNPLAKAVAAARRADVVIAVVGITSQLEGEELRVSRPGFKGGDRTTLDLPQEEEELLEAIHATGKPLVVVLMNGSALAVKWAQDHANAIVDAWYSGEEGGTAIAKTLSGTNNPAGRLPVTFYKDIEQLPAFEDYSMKNRTYRYFAGEPLYRFGFGLSYSSFEYDNLKLSSYGIEAGEGVGVDADVRNTSARDGDEVTQVYLSFPKVEGAPRLALRGMTRVHLGAGQMRHLHFDLISRDLSLVNGAGERIVAPGSFSVSVGGGQPNAGLRTLTETFKVQGTRTLPE
jgi:beta-glucosidase